MKIAIPLKDGLLDAHFGHCDTFALLNVDMEQKNIASREDVEAPPHEPGLLPAWLAERGVNLVITGGMGKKAVDLCQEQQIQVIMGAASLEPEALVTSFLDGALLSGNNACDH